MYIHRTQLAWVFAWVFFAIGVLGFVPGMTINGYLLGVFKVDALHNTVHIATGLFAALAAVHGYARLFFRIFAIVYAGVAIVGFVQTVTVFGLFGVNLADNLLHAGTALVAALVGYCWCGKCVGCRIARAEDE